MSAERAGTGADLRPGFRGGLMVCGTTSDAGKSSVVTALCRLLARRGVSVAPFKAQNMANNSYVCPTGHEIGRAQGVQALAAGIEPEVAMNPVLLKPTGERTSQVVVMGRPVGHLSAAEYHERKPELLGTVLGALADLRRRFDVVVVEGAGSPTEINLLDHDIVNLRIAHEADLPAIVVGDIDRGGVFAALYGTVALLPDHYRRLVRGFVVNKLRGDPALLFDGCAQLEAACGVPTLGVLPWISDVALDAEDSLALDGRRPRPAGNARAAGDELDVAVVRFPRLSNFTDLDALSIEPGVGVRFVTRPAELGRPDLVVLPGSKATLADLAWLRDRGFEAPLAGLTAGHDGPTVLGLCGGYQMLGATVADPDGIETDGGRPEAVPGLGLLDVRTTFARSKVTRPRRGTALDQPVEGYEIHHGRTERGPGAEPWIDLDDGWGREVEGAVRPNGSRVLGTALHGLFESDGLRAAFLTSVGRRAGKAFVPAGVSFAAARADQFDRLADLVEAHVDLDHLAAILTEGVNREPIG
jgi:adenosylcobyric acid synthase